MNEATILNLGAGVQSTALYVMSLARDEPDYVPVYDFAVFADTQEEPTAVYEHMDWLRSLGGPPILMATAGKLGDDLIAGTTQSAGRRFSSIPCFTKSEGNAKEGRTPRQCTRDYKISVIDRVVRREIVGIGFRQRMHSEVSIAQHIGLSFDEPLRVAKTKGRFAGVSWSTPKFPLFDMEWNRSDCRAYLEDRYPGRQFVRSSCVFCPYHENAEWVHIRDTDPDGWERAIELDKAIRTDDARCARGLDKPLFLHRSCVPLSEAVIDTPETNIERHSNGLAQECDGVCGT